MGLLLIIDQLLLPSLMIQDDQFFGGIEVGVEPVRDQGVDLAVPEPLRVVPRGADHPHHDPVTILLTVGGRPIDPGQIRAVGQVADRLEDQVILHPYQDPRAPRRHLIPEGQAELEAEALVELYPPRAQSTENDFELRERTYRVEAELIAINEKHAGVNSPLPR